MKKLSILLLSGLLGMLFLTPAIAGWGGRSPAGGPVGNGFGPGNCGGPGYTADLEVPSDQTRQEFLDQSRELRQQLYDKKSAYYDLMQQENPDKGQASQLWSEIFDLQAQLQKMATDAGFPVGARRWCNGGNVPGDCSAPGYGNGSGGGYGPRGGYGRGCDGPGGQW